MWLIRVLFLVLALPVFAGDFSRADAPAWVDDIALPASDPRLLRASREGIFYLLVDSQVAWDGETKLDYRRIAMQVVDRAGLEYAATVSKSFDPAFDDLTLTRLDVIRDGQVTSYRDDLPHDIFRRETRLDAGIIDGTLTVHLQIPDLKVGDIVDTGFLWRSEPVVPESQRSVEEAMEYSVPVVLTRHVANWPSVWPFFVGPLPGRVTHSERTGTGTIRHEWRRAAHLPTRREEMLPVEEDPDAVLRYGAWENWEPLDKALSAYYLADYPLSGAWEEKVAAIAAAVTDDAGRATAALRLVQDEIRYVGLEVGAGGYFARTPLDVTTRGFGDCKDKSLLLRTILGRLGIESEVALTDLDAGYALPELRPSLYAFDHMILRAKIGGLVVWMDPTASHQGGSVASAVQPDYGYALPLSGKGQGALERIAQNNGMAWQSSVLEQYRFSFLGTFLTVSSVYKGQAADSRRYKWATSSHSDMSRDYQEFYADKYPGIEVFLPLSATDDRTANVFTMTERYRIPNPALDENGLAEDFVFAAEDFGRLYPDVQIGPRHGSLALPEQKYFRHVVEVLDAPIVFQPPDSVRIENPSFVFTYKGASNTPGSMQLEWLFRTKKRLVAAKDVARVIKDARAVGDHYWFSWDLRPE
ncbi:MAG: DUF3857 domain-containing protein [Albidovulum sp.]